MVSLKDKSWSPYVAGILIGLLQIPAFMIMSTALGTSSSYVTAAVNLGQFFDTSILEISYAKQHFEGAKNYWQLFVVVGIIIGAFLSSRLSGTKRSDISPIWTNALCSSTRLTRFIMAFIGGFIMLLGARIADGCTSGHGISGVSQLTIGSMIAVFCMFVGGIITAFFFKRVNN